MGVTQVYTFQLSVTSLSETNWEHSTNMFYHSGLHSHDRRQERSETHHSMASHTHNSPKHRQRSCEAQSHTGPECLNYLYYKYGGFVLKQERNQSLNSTDCFLNSSSFGLIITTIHHSRYISRNNLHICSVNKVYLSG